MTYSLVPEEYLDILGFSNGILLHSEKNNLVFEFFGIEYIFHFSKNYSPHITKEFEEVMFLGDECGGHFLYYMERDKRRGIYSVSHSNTFYDDAVYLCGSLTDLLCRGEGWDYLRGLSES